MTTVIGTSPRPRLRDSSRPQNAPDPQTTHGIKFSSPAISESLADRNRRFQPDPQHMAPADLFMLGTNTCTVPGYRFIRKNDQRQMLMFCDGSCSANGQGGDPEDEPRGGAGVVFTCDDIMPNGIAIPLEKNGIMHTCNRAELRAVVLGLGIRDWTAEGFESVVIASDSDYVILGITDRIKTWVERGWGNESGRAVPDQDLWKVLLQQLREFEKKGCLVQFWKIPREWNEADSCAKNGAQMNDPQRDSETFVEAAYLEYLTDD